MEKLITVEEWIARTFESEGAPDKGTVWRWIREGKIYPMPRKHGRRYYLTTGAKYLANPLVRRVVNGQTT